MLKQRGLVSAERWCPFGGEVKKRESKYQSMRPQAQMIDFIEEFAQTACQLALPHAYFCQAPQMPWKAAPSKASQAVRSDDVGLTPWLKQDVGGLLDVRALGPTMWGSRPG